MTILDTFVMLFESDTSKLEEGLKGLVGKTKGATEGFKDAEDAVLKFIKGTAGILGVGLSFGALVAGIKATAKSYNELGLLATRFRSSAESIDTFRDAAGLLGITEETSTAALKGLDTAVQDTFLGLGRAKAVFKELGITVTDAHGKIKPTTEVMGELAGKFSKMEKGTQIRVMERLGLDPSLLKLFNADMVALQKRMTDVDKASGFNLEKAVKRSQEYTKATKGMALEVNVLKMYMEKLKDGFVVAALPYFTEALKTATKYVRIFSDYLMQHKDFVVGVFIALGSAIMYFLVPAAIKGALTVWAMFAPFLLIIAAVAAVGLAFALLYDDVMNFMAGNDSMVGRILSTYPAIAAAVKQIVKEFLYSWNQIKNLASFLIDVWNDPAKAFDDFLMVLRFAMKEAGDFIMGIWDAIVAKVMAVVDAVKAGVQGMAAYLGMGGPSNTASAQAEKIPGGPSPRAAAQAEKIPGLAAGQAMLGAARAAPLAGQTSGSLGASSSKTTNVQVGKVEVHTQATDAEGISKAIGGSMRTQMQQAANNYDDGVLG